ncbi:MAG: HD domain-containing protein [Spirochaetaceae bacterium]|nr:MAG: HD domain-containing protein [Spirochaetaceae bacterium]
MAQDAEKLRNIISLDSELNKVQDEDILLERILLEARRVVGADAGSIYAVRDDHLVINYAQNDTKQKELPPGQKLIYKVFNVPINKKTISGYAAATGEPLNIADVYNIPESAPYGFDPSYDIISAYRSHSMLAVPLKTNTGEILGVIQMINKMGEDGSFEPFDRDDELLVMHFATNATVALQRAHMTRAILLRMIRMAELRDPKETGPHVNRVAGYSVEIYDAWASRAGIPRKEIERTRDNLRMAAMLHDVGKVAISDTILKKPGRFTPEEHDIMKNHAIHGARLFMDRQSEFDELAQVVALNHHENWDGTGYPGHVDLSTGEPIDALPDGKARGKRGEEIPILGRIVSIADVYDALRSKRVYKDAWDEKEALFELRRLQGSKFDPELVDIFFDVLPAIERVSETYSRDE